MRNATWVPLFFEVDNTERPYQAPRAYNVSWGVVLEVVFMALIVIVATVLAALA
jgi:hypothetical protein